MKKILFAYLLAFVSVAALAQETQEKDNDRREGGRERIKAARVAYLTERMELTSAEAEKFWPVYREYAEKREGLMENARKARESETDDKKKVEALHQARQQQLDLEKSYSPKFLAVISADKLLRMNEAERDFNDLVRKQAHKRGHRGMRGGRGQRR